jgi:predicted SprT family Zn-dependent metalloprotease
MQKTKTIYCKICENAYIETLELNDNIIYTCNMCNDNAIQDGNLIMENNFIDNLVIDSSN